MELTALEIYLSTDHCESLTLGGINLSLKQEKLKNDNIASQLNLQMCWYESQFFGYQTNNVWWFTGIILLPGSFSGRMSSPRPHRGPLQKNIVKTTKVKQKCESREKWIIQLCTDLPNNRMSFAIFIREVATVLSAPLVSTKASCAACKKNIPL